MLLAKADETVFKSFSQILLVFSSTYIMKLLMIQNFSVIKMFKNVSLLLLLGKNQISHS